MKIYSSITNPVQSGTTYYSVTIDDILDAYSDPKENIWVRQAFIEDGFDAIDFSNNLFGSDIISNTLYICVTDGKDIVIDGKPYNPETIIQEYGIDLIQEYIKAADKKTILRYISEYEIYPPDFNAWAADMLNEYDFTDLVEDYKAWE